MELLVSMVEFILTNKYTEQQHRNYAEFLSKPLKLGFFIPCDFDRNVIPEKENHFTRKELEEYSEAEKCVLFKGFESIGENLFTARVANGINSYLIRDIETGMIVEDLVKDGLELTESAKKQILGL